MSRRALLFVLLGALALSGCEFLALGIQAGIGGIAALIDAQLRARPVTQQIVQTAYVEGADVQENFRVLDVDLTARGYALVGSAQRATIATGAVHDAHLRLTAGQCYAVAAVGVTGVRDVAVAFFDPRGQRVEGDAGVGPHPVARACVSETGVYRARMYMRDGGGEVRYAAYRWTRGTQGPFDLSGLLYVHLAEATALLDAQGYAPDPSFTPIKGRLGEQGARRAHRLSLDEGGCLIVVAVGGEGLHDLDASLDYGGDVPAIDSDRSSLVALEACADTHRSTSLTVASANGSGEYFFQVFRRSGG